MAGDTGRRRRSSKRPPRIERSAGGVVYRRVDGEVRFLLILDPYGNWGLPKGHLEGDEAPEEAALREVEEETSLTTLRIHGPMDEIDWFFRDGRRLVHKFCTFYLMESTNGTATPRREEGISECVWLPYDEAVARIGYDNTRDVLRQAALRLGLTGTESIG
jgi:8-oxo-dGTP pyrophosphatase MutT (NUDIX family)